jgi:hypothetical protein
MELECVVKINDEAAKIVATKLKSTVDSLFIQLDSILRELSLERVDRIYFSNSNDDMRRKVIYETNGKKKFRFHWDNDGYLYFELGETGPHVGSHLSEDDCKSMQQIIEEYKCLEPFFDSFIAISKILQNIDSITHYNHFYKIY